MFKADSTSDGERYTLFPVKSSETRLYHLYKQAVASFWTVEEIDFSKDERDWESLTENEVFFVKHVLAFFAGSDGIVQENLAERFQRDVQSPVARLFYSFQNAVEGIHSETYSLLIEKYVKDKQEKNKLFRAIDNTPCIKKKAQWALKWVESTSSYATRLVAFACVEGIFFSGAFCAIYWIKKRGLMPGLTFTNELISRDEALHTEFAILLYSKLVKKLNKKRIYEIIQEAVEIEKEFITEAIPCRMIGMNHKLMTQYIEFVADRLILQLGYDKVYNVSNPFDFMELISIESKVNFFERTNAEYALANKTCDSNVFEFNADF